MADKPQYYYYQSAVIPYRWCEEQLEILLISTRAQQRWVVPKGIIELGMTPEESAAKEAWEEAGIRGKTLTPSIGKYQYRKWGGICEVTVFPMQVDTILPEWPEQHFRRREWRPMAQALEMIQDNGLAALLRRLEEELKL